jgi:8-oxo-dGTP diphosphatase
MRTAACAVIFRDDRVLLGRRSASRRYYPGVWDLFGGHVRPGEAAADALARELREELGIVPLDVAPSLVVDEPDPATHGPGVFHVFLVTRWRGEPVLTNAEHDALGWFTLADVATLQLADIALLDVLRNVAPWRATP